MRATDYYRLAGCSSVGVLIRERSKLDMLKKDVRRPLVGLAGLRRIVTKIGLSPQFFMGGPAPFVLGGWGLEGGRPALGITPLIWWGGVEGQCVAIGNFNFPEQRQVLGSPPGACGVSKNAT